MIRCAYLQGAFPMGEDDGSVDWYQPRRRALLPISGIHVSTSLQKTIRKEVFEVRFDTEFELVVRSCVRPSGNWINEAIVRAYTQIHLEGWAHCSECWQGSELVGGVYGVCIGSCFCAESMFHRASNASKVALWALVEKCRELCFTLFDAQMMSPHLASIGAFEVSHREYLKLLDEASKRNIEWDG